MNQKWWVIGSIIVGCMLVVGCNYLQSDPGQGKETETPIVTEIQVEKKIEITPTIQPDPCGWREREEPIVTEIQDGKRVELAPKIGKKKLIFIYEEGDPEVSEIKNVRIEINPEDYITFLKNVILATEADLKLLGGNPAFHKQIQEHLDFIQNLEQQIQGVENYFKTNNELNGEQELIKLWDIFLAYERSNVILDYKGASGWYYDLIEEGKAAIYDIKTDQCVPYIEVITKCFGPGKCWDMYYYLPNGILFYRVLIAIE